MKIRSGFVSNSSSSSFVIRNGGCEYWMKLYGTSFDEKKGCVQFSIVKVDRHGFPVVEREKILKLQSLFRDEKFSHIQKFIGSEGITTDGKSSFIYEDGGSFFGRLYEKDVPLINDIKGVLG